MIISPSICTGGYGQVVETLRWLEARGADRIHVDIMDGRYVRPIMGGTDYVDMLRAETQLPLELHFMCRDPERFLDMYRVRAGEIVCVHADSTYHPHRLLQSIRDRGAVPCLVLSVADVPEDSAELLDQAREILLMGVETGRPATAFCRQVPEKIGAVKRLAAGQGLSMPVGVDGSVGPGNIAELVQAGADSVVLGYPGCFDPVRGREETLSLMLRLIAEAEEEAGRQSGGSASRD